MGQKHPNRRLKRSDTASKGLRRNNSNLFDDAVDLEEESEILKIGDQTTQKCPTCSAVFPTDTLQNIRFWIQHKKLCKLNQERNNNQINNINVINQPPPNLNNNNLNQNIPQPPSSNIPIPPPPPPPIINDNNIPPPPVVINNNIIPPPPPPPNNLIIPPHPQNNIINPPPNNVIRPPPPPPQNNIINPPPNNVIRPPPPPPNNIIYPPPNNIINPPHNNIIRPPPHPINNINNNNNRANNRPVSSSNIIINNNRNNNFNNNINNNRNNNFNNNINNNRINNRINNNNANNNRNNNRNEKKCPLCQVYFRYDTQYYKNLFFQHLSGCRSNQNNSNLSNRNIPNVQNRPIRVNANNQELNNILDSFGLETKKVLPRGKKDGTFEEKVDYLRFDISKKKIDFINGAEKLNINREKVLENSMEQFEKINPFKELKIIFIGEESFDAGGLIREWLTILFQKILDVNTGLFIRSDTEEVGYLIKPNLNPSQDILNKYFFIGRVLAKALLENLTVNCCFNKVVYQLILGEKIQLNDLVFIDKPLYNSMKHLVSMKDECAENIALCEIYFTYDYEGTDGTQYQQDLVENGSDILVTQDNLDLYIDKRIEYFTKSQMGGIKQIISGINSIFPCDYLKIFTSDQLGLLINGTPFIDIEDWRMNTIYKNYNDYDNVIIDFWDIISNLSQEELSNFLLFCTGSSRVPIGGFKSLESNRGQISKFEIVKSTYYEGKKNFLRAHTCFNRLDLPTFPDRNTLNEAIKFALENEVLGFGIE